MNSYWSPLYPILCAITLKIVPVSPFSELPIIHALNVGIFAGTLIAFEYLWKSLITLITDP